ncbi:MAG TPA: hypothetical protein VMU53_12195 [Candidatus Sulfotelmatobacter sp.]|nr:hypothetical protein [Candidatus Sulfotelmatobacter sp.]
MDFLNSRSQPHFGMFEAIVFSLYCVLLGSAVAYHQPWADEAQSWLLARDLSLGQLFAKYLHYEGSPGAWHALLWVLTRLHVSYAGMHWLTAGIAATAIWIFLVYSPFPPVVRAIVPFTFYLAYQYAVIARSYALFPLVAFLLAIFFKDCPRRLIWCAVILGSLGNVCTQGLLVAAGFAVALAVDLWRRRKDLDRTQMTPARLFIAATVMIGLWLFALWASWPAPDNSFVVLGKLPAYAKSVMPLLRGKIGLQLATLGLSNSIWISLVVLTIVLVHLVHSKALALGLPYLLLVAFFFLVVARPWHYGMLFVTLLTILWITWPSGAKLASASWRWESYALILCLLVISVEHLSWTYRAVLVDFKASYSGDRQAAEFLKTHAAGKRVAGFHFWSIGVLPYFPSNIYSNQSDKAFWFWSTAAHIDDRAIQVVDSRPDFIVVGWASPIGGGLPLFADPFQLGLEGLGYHRTHQFCGKAFSGHGYTELLCQNIFEPVQPGGQEQNPAELKPVAH